MIVDRLLEFVPSDVPSTIIWPAFEEQLFTPQPAPARLRRRLGISGGDMVIVYAGNVHPTNAAEVRSLYLAIALLNRRGLPVKLVRLGQDYVDFYGDIRHAVERNVVKVSFRPREEVPLYYALADALVQPGRPDDFNDYRIPSKLPEFFAMGRPVILPRTNIGLVAKDGESACTSMKEMPWTSPRRSSSSSVTTTFVGRLVPGPGASRSATSAGRRAPHVSTRSTER